MKLLFTFLFLVSLSLAIPCFSQRDTSSRPSFPPREIYREKALKLLIGGHLQQAYRTDGTGYNRKYFEIGLHKTITVIDQHHPGSMLTHGISMELSPEARPIYGFKYSAWVEVWCLVLGLGGIYYTNFEQGNFKIRPEIGIGLYPFKLSAGYNIPTIRNSHFAELQRANGQVTLNILLKLKTLKQIPLK